LNIFLVLLHDLQLVMVIWYSKEEGRWMKELWFTEPEKCSNNENENNVTPVSPLRRCTTSMAHVGMQADQFCFNRGNRKRKRAEESLYRN
jgi:hypothetical protein